MRYRPVSRMPVARLIPRSQGLRHTASAQSDAFIFTVKMGILDASNHFLLRRFPCAYWPATAFMPTA
jgi:hypothetical protein